jgi:hypothetical protein
MMVMRLSDVLSRPCSPEFVEIDGFLSKKLSVGKQRKIDVGKVALNFFCALCNNSRTFLSVSELYCIAASTRQVSIDCVLNCVGECGSSAAVWYLVECQDGEDTDTDKQYMNNYIYGIAPKVRILKRREKLSEQVRLVEQYGEYTTTLDKARRAHRDGLGAGLIVYLRKILEKITVQAANAASIGFVAHESGNPKNFKALFEKVEKQCHIIPDEFSADGYRLFGELSDVVHGEYDENVAIQKFEPLYELVKGILDRRESNRNLTAARGALWGDMQNGGTA